MFDPRASLADLAADRAESLSELSRMLRRNPAYLQQFLHRGSPRRLSDEDARMLADHFGVPSSRFGLGGGEEVVGVPYLAVRAAAGSGLVGVDERVVREEPFAAGLLRDAGVSPRDASIVTAAGDSMAPGIVDGDRLLIDAADRRPGARGAVYVLRRDEAVQVKRLTALGREIEVASDNPAYPTARVPAREVTVIGRVALLLRRP